MAVINTLPRCRYDRCGRGRRASASRHQGLMENSFDAGAKSVTVEIKGGGAPFIRVTDDGCGMAPEDAGVAFLRHATSSSMTSTGLKPSARWASAGESSCGDIRRVEVELTTRRRGDDEHLRHPDRRGHSGHGPCRLPEGTVMAVKGFL